VEWVLVSCGSSMTVRPADDDANPTPNPVPSKIPSHYKELKHEPTADNESTTESAPTEATQQNCSELS